MEHAHVSDVFVARGDRLAARKVAGEMVILLADDSSLFVLNAVGTAIWEAADGVTPLSAIVEDVICRQYEIDPDTAVRDMLEFVTALEEHGLMVTSGSARAAEAPSNEVG
jgi:Coenzyme PQQ synthesis protein D (PqqD)